MSGTTINRTIQGERIRFARRVRDLSQRQLAMLVSEQVTVPISHNIISQIEKGERGVWNDEMLALEDILDQDKEWLEGRGGEFKRPKGVSRGWVTLPLAV